MHIGIREARRQFSTLVMRAERGETVVITKNGREVARLGPPERQAIRQGGWMKQDLVIADDFNELPDDIIEAMQGDGT